MTRYRIRLLLTYDDDSEELHTFIVEAENTDAAIQTAKRQARQDERVIEVECQMTGVQTRR